MPLPIGLPGRAGRCLRISGRCLASPTAPLGSHVLCPAPPNRLGTTWTTSVSNRARDACKASLRTCASPLEPTPGIEPGPAAYETAARTVVLRWHREPVTRFERAVSDLQDRRESQPAPPARAPSPGLEPSFRRSERRVLPNRRRGRDGSGRRSRIPSHCPADRVREPGPCSARGGGRPGRSPQSGPQWHPCFLRRLVTLALVARPAGRYRVEPGVLAASR